MTRHARAPGDPSRQEWIALLIRLELRRMGRRWCLPIYPDPTGYGIEIPPPPPIVYGRIT